MLSAEPAMSTPVSAEAQAAAEALKAEANTLYSAKRYASAIDKYTEAIDMDPTNAVYYRNRAASYVMCNMNKDAVADCQKSLEIDPSSGKTYARLVKSAIALDDFQTAEYYVAEGAKRCAGNSTEAAAVAKAGAFARSVRDLYQSAVAAAEKGDLILALRNLEICFTTLDSSINSEIGSSISRLAGSSLSSIPVNWRILRCKYLLGLGDVVEATVSLNDLASSSTKADDVLILRVKAFYMSESQTPDRLIATLQNIVANDPDNKRAITLLKEIKSLERVKLEGNGHFKAQDWEKAIEAYDRCVGSSDMNAMVKVKAMSNKANALSKQGKYSESVKICDEAIDMLFKIEFGIDPKASTSTAPKAVTPQPSDITNTMNSKMFRTLYLRRADSHTKNDALEDAQRDYNFIAEVFEEDIEIRRAKDDIRIRIKQSKKKDYYKILGVDRSASESEIKKAFRKKAIQCHPDKVITLDEEEKTKKEAEFKLLNEAHSVLTDPQKKHLFDSGVDVDGANASGPSQADMFGGGFGGMHGMGGGFGGMHGMGGGFGGMHGMGGGMHGMGGGMGGGLSEHDILNMFMNGGMGGGGGGGRARGFPF